MEQEKIRRAGRDIPYNPAFDRELLDGSLGASGWAWIEAVTPDAHLVTPVQSACSRWSGAVKRCKTYGSPAATKQVMVVAEIRGTPGPVEIVRLATLVQAVPARPVPAAKRANTFESNDPAQLLKDGLADSARSAAQFVRNSADAVEISGAVAEEVLSLALRQAISAMAALLKESGGEEAWIDGESAFEPTFSSIFHRNLPPMPLATALAVEHALVAQLREQLVERTMKADFGLLRSTGKRLMLTLRDIERPPLGPRVQGFVKATPL